MRRRDRDEMRRVAESWAYAFTAVALVVCTSLRRSNL
jgi:hypothetical protein